MKFFWKLFFSVMLISTACVTASGCLLISSNFREQLNIEQNTAEDYGNLVRYFLMVQQESAGKDESSNQEENPDEVMKRLAGRTAGTVIVDGTGRSMEFSVLDENGRRIFSSLKTKTDPSMALQLNGHTAGERIRKDGGSVYIQLMQPVTYGDRLYYTETIRDVSAVFANQREQYEMMIRIIVMMMAAGGFFAFLISRLLMRPVAALTETTKVIAEGDLGRRAPIGGQDEIALLSEHFNRMADSLEEKIEQLEEEAERKERFVGAFSHELKTPLTAVIGYGDLLRQQDLDPEQRQICADYIFSEGKRLERMSMRLLDLIVLKKQKLYLEATPVDRFLQRITEKIKQTYETGRIRFVLKAEPAVFLMEPDLMETVFSNLLDNARKAVEEQGLIEVLGESLDGAYRVMIRDSGKGMEEAELLRITEAFYMVDRSRARQQGGAGLGLAICQEILRLHGFSMKFESRAGKGTCVTVMMKEQTDEQTETGR